MPADFNYLPYSGNKYKVYKRGEVEGPSKISVILRNKEHYIRLDWIYGFIYYQKSLIKAIAAANPSLPLKYWRNLMMENGKLVFRKTLLWSEDKDFAYIPGYTNYVINKTGTIRYIEDNTPMYTFSGRVVISSDEGKAVNESITDLLKAAWGKEKIHVADVNILVRDSYKTLTIYGDIESISQDLGISRTAIYNALGDGRQRVIKGEYQLKLDDGTPWKDGHFNRTLGYIKGVKAFNPTTGDLLTFESCKACCDHFKMKKSSLTYFLQPDKTLHGNGYMFKLESDDTPWPVIVDVKKALNRFHKFKPVILTNVITGDVIEYPSMAVCKIHTRLNHQQLAYRLKRPDEVFEDCKYKFLYN